MAPQRAVDECTLALLIQVVHLGVEAKATVSSHPLYSGNACPEGDMQMHATAEEQGLTLQLVFLDSTEP